MLGKSGLDNKSISVFYAERNYNSVVLLDQKAEAYESFLAVNSNRSVCVVNDSQIIPEPEEYGFVFGLFALSLVVVRQRFHKKWQAITIL